MLMSKIRFNNTQLTRSVGTAPLAELLNLPAAYSNATLTRTMVNPTPNTGDGFGVSVAVCESYSIVGASLDDSTGTDSGYAYIYDNATGNLLHSIANPNIVVDARNLSYGQVWYLNGPTITCNNVKIIYSAGQPTSVYTNSGTVTGYDMVLDTSPEGIALLASFPSY